MNRTRWLATIGTLLIAAALVAPAPAAVARSSRYHLRWATGGRAPTSVAPRRASTALPIHPRALRVAKAAADARAAARLGPPPAAPATAASAAAAADGWEGEVDPTLTPPDPTGAIGPTRYIEMVNLRFGIYDRTGALIGDGTLASLAGSGSDLLSDPQILWDPQTRHFYYLVLDVSTDEFAIGWSRTESPNGPADFCQYFASYGYAPFYLPDYPKLGTTRDFLVIGANVFFNFIVQSYVGSDVDWLDKPPAGPLATCPDPSTFHLGSFVAVKSADGSDATTPVPAVQTDANGTGWVVATPDASVTANANFLTAFPVSGTTATGASLGAPVTVPVASFDVPASAPQPGGPTLDTLDGRLERAVSGVDPLRGGVNAVWTAHAVFGGAGSEERWYELDPAAGGVLQSGVATSPTLSVWNGAVSPDRAVDNGTTAYGGSMVMGFDTSSPSALPAIQMVTKSGTDPQSGFTMVRQSPGANVDFSCSAPYGPPCRWGDYSGASADPTPDLSCPTGSVWLSGEWNVASTDPSGTDWRTWNWQAFPQACSPGTGSPPGAPTLSARALRGGGVRLTWTVPPDGGSQIDGYVVYRGTSATSQPLLVSLDAVTIYTDTTVVTGGRYFYAVSAVNVNGEGPRSNVVRVRAR